MIRKKASRAIFEPRAPRSLSAATARSVLPTAAAIFVALMSGCGRSEEIHADPLGKARLPVLETKTPEPVAPVAAPRPTPGKLGGGLPIDVVDPYVGPLAPPPPKAAVPIAKPPVKPHPKPPHLGGDMAATRAIDIGELVKIDRPVHA